jgi:ABC-type uncharacterized transport system substrate-binding protein
LFHERFGKLLERVGKDDDLRNGTQFVQELARLGWANGSNVRIEQRWTNADIDRARPLAKELVQLQPDVILVSTTPVVPAARPASTTAAGPRRCAPRWRSPSSRSTGWSRPPSSRMRNGRARRRSG